VLEVVVVVALAVVVVNERVVAAEAVQNTLRVGTHAVRLVAAVQLRNVLHE